MASSLICHVKHNLYKLFKTRANQSMIGGKLTSFCLISQKRLIMSHMNTCSANLNIMASMDRPETGWHPSCITIHKMFLLMVFSLMKHQSHLVSPRTLSLILFCFSYISMTFLTSLLTCAYLLMTLSYAMKLYLKMTTVSCKLILNNLHHGLTPGECILMSQSTI